MVNGNARCANGSPEQSAAEPRYLARLIRRVSKNGFSCVYDRGGLPDNVDICRLRVGRDLNAEVHNGSTDAHGNATPVGEQVRTRRGPAVSETE
jgi:hypothetical protein